MQSIEDAKKLVEKIVQILASNLSKQEFLDFQSFTDGTGPGNYFDQLLEEKAIELDPESFGPFSSEKLVEYEND